MIKNHSRTHSSNLQRHPTAIINIDNKHTNNKKPPFTKNYLSPSQKNSILQNGPFILKFIKEKLQMINSVHHCNQNLAIQNYRDSKFSQQVKKMRQNTESVKTKIIQPFFCLMEKQSNCSELNEAIYQFLNELSESNQKTMTSLDNLKVIPEPNDKQLSKNDQKLKEYFYSFLISLAATQYRYHQFLDGLYEQLFFDSEFTPQKIETFMAEDTEYCIRILIIALTNKFHKIIKDSKFAETPHLTYFPNQKNFLKLTLSFILTNALQITEQIHSFTLKFAQIKTLIETHNIGINPTQTSENLKNTLSRYLPQESRNQFFYQSQYTFSPRELNNLKSNLLRSYNVQTHLDDWSYKITLLQHIFLKICFKRIVNCRRINFEAAYTIFETLENARIHKLLAFQGLKHIFIHCQQSKKIQELQDDAQQKYERNLMKKTFKGYRQIKHRKQKLLKLLVKKKINFQTKEQTLLFNLWRINASRMRLSQKILAHSHSCTAVLNKFTEDYIQQFENKKIRNTGDVQQSVNRMREITLKKSSSLKSGLNQSRISHNSKAKNYQIHQKTTNQDLRLLNYQYKQSIIEKLNKKSRKEKERQVSNKTHAGTQSKTLLKV